MALWEKPRKCLQDQADYLKNQIVKPYNWSVDQTKRIVLFYLPPPSKKNQGPKDIKNRNPDLRTISAQDMRQIQFKCMPENYQEKLSNLETDWADLEAMSDQLWLDHLRRIESKDTEQRKAREALKKKFACSQKEDGKEESEPSRKKRAKFHEKPDRKPSWQGQARARP